MNTLTSLLFIPKTNQIFCLLSSNHQRRSISCNCPLRKVRISGEARRAEGVGEVAHVGRVDPGALHRSAGDLQTCPSVNYSQIRQLKNIQILETTETNAKLY